MSAPERIKAALTWLNRAWRSDRLAHAYLIIGSPHGDARAFIEKALPLLLCESGDQKACGACRACRRLDANRHQDVRFIEPQGKSRSIPVDTIRDLIHWFSQTALSGGRKVAVIWGAERLGPEAANAFLKTLEEPPSGSLFLLVTPAPAAVLPTIRSRCQRLALSEPEDVALPADVANELLAILAELEPEKPTAPPAWQGMAAAQRFLALCAGIRKEIEDSEKTAAGELDEAEVVAARSTARFKQQRAVLLQFLHLWYRDVLLTVCGAEAGLLRHGGSPETVQRTAGRLRYVEALEKLETLETLHRHLETNIPEGVAVHTAFAELAANQPLETREL